MKRFFQVLIGVGLLFSSCKQHEEKNTETLYELLPAETTGIEFKNDLTYTREFNVYKYRNFYNGGGVAIGDINNDGLVDVYMTANQGPNKLFLNKGDFKFEDITETSGVQGSKAWSTGVTMVDINADGYLDIYVCNSGDLKGDDKENELFINNGDLTFTEAASSYGLNDPGYSTHAAFFDYDQDGDLDAYILNNSFQAIGSFNLRKSERPVRDALGGDKLMRNDGGKFVDVSESAGIYGSVIGFGLGITIGDFNNDGWQDIFISNDFFERDYLYYNNGDGTFKESLEAQMRSTSGASMGADVADINNDGHQDIFVTEMLPSDYTRLKSVTTFENWDKYQYNVVNGYHHQFTRNVLHHNNGNGTFSEISRMAGVQASDWSWGALFLDMDNDGYKDLFIANGIYKDLTDQDYLQYIANESVMQSIIQDTGVNYQALIDIIPSNPVPNHAYKNLNGQQFEPYTSSGLWEPSFSNGAAYGDLDNDGDLDLVVNNVGMPVFVYRNHASDQSQSAYLQINLIGDGQNTNAIGARVEVTGPSMTIIHDHQPARGFQSSVDPCIHIGLGELTAVDIKVTWPDRRVTMINGVQSNQRISISKADGSTTDSKPKALTETKVYPASIPQGHKENPFVDFNRERLLYHMMSTQGPCTSVADMDQDGSPELILPGPKGSPTMVYSKQSNQWVSNNRMQPTGQSLGAEYVECEVNDYNGDGLPDLYMASGGTELSEFDNLLHDRIWVNNGKGGLIPAPELPWGDNRISTGSVASGDFNGDGYADIFVGERVKIGQYGIPCSGYLWLNDGTGKFSEVTQQWAPELSNIGMITDAQWVDINKDGKLDLLLAGEFMDIEVWYNRGDHLEPSALSDACAGWWNVVETADIDGDGDLDIIAGNHGLNSQFNASEEAPIRMYVHDFDGNSFTEPIMAQKLPDGKYYPYALRHNLVSQMPGLKKKFPDFASFKAADMEQVFSPESLKAATLLEANELRTTLWVNNGNGVFKKSPLPQSVQKAPIYAILPHDLDGDGDMDLVMGGNLYGVQPEVGRYDGSYGHLLINDGSGSYIDQAVPYGFSVIGEIRDFKVIDNKLFIFRNNDTPLVYDLPIEKTVQ